MSILRFFFYVFRCFGRFVYYKLLVVMRLSDSVYVSVYMKIISRYVRDIFEHVLKQCPKSVKHFRTKYLLEMYHIYIYKNVNIFIKYIFFNRIY